jgi:hypothetical protein
MGKRMSWQIYQSPDAIVDKYQYRAENDTVPLLVASLDHCCDSVHIYGKKQELLFYNNRFGAFDQATEIDLLNLYTVFSYLQRLYSNTKDAIDIIRGIYTNPTRRFFNLLRVNTETVVQCTAFPVLTNGKLLGVVVTDDKAGVHRVHPHGNTQLWKVDKTQLPSPKNFS